MKKHDAIILGTSPNALCAAIVLARGGLSVLVLDTHAAPGGPVATEEFAPGYLADTGVASAALDAEVTRDLGLEIPVLRRRFVTSLAPQANSIEDVPLPVAFHDAVDLLRAAYRTPALDVPVESADAVGAASLDALVGRLRGLGDVGTASPGGGPARRMHEVLRLLLLSVRDFLREAEIPEVHQGLLTAVAMRSRHAGPFDAGTLFGLLHHAALEDGLFVSTVKGGLGQLPRTLAEVAVRAGAEIRVGVPGPLRIAIDNGVARGVRFPSGEVVPASRVLSDHDARGTFTKLVSPADLDPEFNRTVRQIRYRGNVARVHLALDRLPTFPGLAPEATQGTLVLAAGPTSVERAWDVAKRGGLPPNPPIEVALPTVLDPSLAPEGKHVLSATVQYVPGHFTDRAAVLRAVLGCLAPFAPDLQGIVVASHVSLPRDIEARFGLTEGHLYGGESALPQAFFLRPFPGSVGPRAPALNLHLCGSAAHPAGYSGLSGWTLARSLLPKG